jgi:cell division protein FtsQ
MAQQRPYKTDNWKIIGTAIAVVVVILIFWSFRRQVSQPLSGFSVELKHLESGFDMIKEKDIINLIQKGFDIDSNSTAVGAIDAKAVESRLEQNEFVEKAEVWIDVRNRLNVRISQREPIIRIIDDQGGNYYLDKNGVRMPASRYYSARVPIATGNIAPYIADFQQKGGYGLKNLFDFTQRLLNDDFFKDNFQQVYVNAAGDFTVVPMIGDQKILFGTLEDLDEKLKLVKVFYQEAMPYEGWKKYATINVKYKGQIICKKR